MAFVTGLYDQEMRLMRARIEELRNGIIVSSKWPTVTQCAYIFSESTNTNATSSESW